MSIEGIAHFPHRYFHQLRDCNTSLFEPEGKQDRKYQITLEAELCMAENALKRQQSP